MQRELWGAAVSPPQIFNTASRIASPDFAGSWEGPSQRVAVCGSLTMNFIAKAVACAIFREGVYPAMYTGLFGSYVQEVLDRSSDLHGFAPQLVAIVPDWRDVVTPLPLDASAEAVHDAVRAKAGLYAELWKALRAVQCTIVQHTVVPPRLAPRGLADRRSPSSPANQVALFTQSLLEADDGSIFWVELDRLAANAGLEHWSPDRFYLNGRIPFDPRFLPNYMRAFGAAWRTANARAKKALVVDLDNTLWGGVIGDDGVDGLQLGPGSPEGEAFADWCSYLKALSARGVVLAVCSKNDPAIALAAFDHPHLPLKRDDFAAFECSWDDKASSLRRIAAQLDLSLDAIVFADDNPAECALVREALPGVGVVELGSDPAAFAGILEREHWFDLPRYTHDDFGRAASYGARTLAETLRAEAPDLSTYLAGLEMTGSFRTASDADLARVAQLERKTNQFNLTTRRYDEPAIRRFAAGDAHVFVFSLRDRFADHGLVGSMIVVPENDAWRIDSWLTSCRVFSRTAEQFVMQRLIERAAAAGVRRILGEYRASEKNRVVAGLFAGLGFAPADESGRMWTLQLDGVDVERLRHFIDDSEEPVGTLVRP